MSGVGDQEIVEWIGGADELVSIYGHWPWFHDAFLEKVTFDAGTFAEGGDVGPSLRVWLVEHAMDEEPDERGTLTISNKCRIEFLFSNVDKLRIENLSYENTLYFLEIGRSSPDSQEFHVVFDSSSNLDSLLIDFCCRGIAITSIQRLE